MQTEGQEDDLAKPDFLPEAPGKKERSLLMQMFFLPAVLWGNVFGRCCCCCCINPVEVATRCVGAVGKCGRWVLWKFPKGVIYLGGSGIMTALRACGMASSSVASAVGKDKIAKGIKEVTPQTDTLASIYGEEKDTNEWDMLLGTAICGVFFMGVFSDFTFDYYLNEPWYDYENPEYGYTGFFRPMTETPTFITVKDWCLTTVDKICLFFTAAGGAVHRGIDAGTQTANTIGKTETFIGNRVENLGDGIQKVDEVINETLDMGATCRSMIALAKEHEGSWWGQLNYGTVAGVEAKCRA